MYAQAGMRLCWSHKPNRWKSHVAAQMVKLGTDFPPDPLYIFLLPNQSIFFAMS